MTALQGTFELMGFGEVATLLAAKEETGRLHVRARALGVDLYLSDGSFTGITMADEPAPASARAARQKLEEVCFELLSADRGTFEFHPGQTGRPSATLAVKVETVLAAARRRAEEWREIREAIPSLDVHPVMAEELGGREITLDRDEWGVLAALDGRRNVHALARKLKLSEFDACRILKSLIDGGAVLLPDAEARRVRSAHTEDGAEPRPPLRISSKKPRAGAGEEPPAGKPEGGKAAGSSANGKKAASGDAEEANSDQKKSRLPTVARLRRTRPDEQS